MESPATVLDAPPVSSPPAATGGKRRRALDAAWVAAQVLGAGVALYLGLALRSWVWEASAEIHWEANVENAFTWGSRVLDGTDRATAGTGEPTWRQLWAGYRTLYDKVDADPALKRNELDYVPFRLLLAATWVRHVRLSDPHAFRWQPEYTRFMLNFNTIAGLAAAAGAFLLVRHWVRVDRLCCQTVDAHDASSKWPAFYGALAALLVWLNAALLLEGYAWPQWDVWPVPFYIFALYLASKNAWTCAGALLAAGALFKGQMLFAAPVLVLWPLFQGRPVAALRVVVGFAALAALGASPWLIHGTGEVALVLALPILATGAAAWMLRRAPRRRRVSVFVLTGMIAFTVAALLAAYFGGDASFAWFRIGYMNGTEKFPVLSRNMACNLPAILGQKYGWKLDDRVFDWSEDGTGGLQLRTLLVLSYGVTLVLSAAGAALHAARRSRYFLVAVTAPWVLMFTLLGQMDGRYLLYGAAVSALFAGAGGGFTSLHLLLTAMNCAMMFKFLIKRFPADWPVATHVLRGIEPGMGWAVILVAAMILYRAVSPANVEKLRQT